MSDRHEQASGGVGCYTVVACVLFGLAAIQEMLWAGFEKEGPPPLDWLWTAFWCWLLFPFVILLVGLLGYLIIVGVNDWINYRRAKRIEEERRKRNPPSTWE